LARKAHKDANNLGHRVWQDRHLIACRRSSGQIRATESAAVGGGDGGRPQTRRCCPRGGTSSRTKGQSCGRTRHAIEAGDAVQSSAKEKSCNHFLLLRSVALIPGRQFWMQMVAERVLGILVINSLISLRHLAQSLNHLTTYVLPLLKEAPT
jgi:hypothetical protein